MMNANGRTRNSQHAKALAAWDQLCAELEAPDLELTLGNFCVIYAHYCKAKAAGVKFERAFVALIAILYRQVFHTDGDSDSDMCVEDWGETEGSEDDILLHPHGRATR